MITPCTNSAFAINPFSCFEPKKSNVCVPFSISTNLPFSIKRGEVFAIPFVVSSYMNIDLDIEVTLDNSMKKFEFAKVSNEVVELSMKFLYYRYFQINS